MHELVREVLHADLVANAEAFHVLATKLQNALLGRFLDAPFETRYRLVFDMFTLRRETDAVKSVGLDGLLRRTARFAANADVDPLATYVARHLDPEEADCFRYWCGRYRDGLVLSLDEEGRAAGLQFMIPMSLVTEEDRTSDPFIDHAHGVWRRWSSRMGPATCRAFVGSSHATDTSPSAPS